MTTGFVLFGLIEDSARFHYPVLLMLQIVCLRLPEMLFYTLPMASLLATLLAVSRLANDQELMSLRLSGLSFWRFASPFIAGSLALALVSIALNETLVPPSAWLARQALHQAQSGQSLSLPRQEHLLYRDLGTEGLRHLIYARSSDGSQLQGVVVQAFREQKLKAVLMADKAYFASHQWQFENGSLLELDAQRTDIRRVEFKSYQMPLAAGLQTLLRESRQPLEMNLADLSAYIAQLDRLGQSVASLQVRWHQKLAVPMAAVIFAILGVVLGARTLRSTSQSLGLSLLIVFVYYLLMSIGTALADSSQVPAWLGAWLPHLVCLPWALILMHKRNQVA